MAMKQASLLVVTLLLLVQLGFAQTSVDDTVIYNGNIITFKQVGLDTFEVIDPVTEEISIKFEASIKPGKVNGKEIYREQESDEPVGGASQKDLNSYLKNYLRSELEAIKPYYNSLELVINEKGELAYLDIHLLKFRSWGSCSIGLSDAKETEVRNNITNKLMALKFIPAKKDGNDVPYYFSMN